MYSRSEETTLQARQIKTISRTEFGIGGVVQNGRTLLFYLLTMVKNGDLVALQKLDSAIVLEDNEDEPDDPSIWIDHSGLVDEKYSTNNILKDLLTFPRSKTSKILRHPVMETFIKQRWRRTKAIFISSFCLYLIFLVLYSSFLGLLFFRQARAKGFDSRVSTFRSSQCPGSPKMAPANLFLATNTTRVKIPMESIAENVTSKPKTSNDFYSLVARIRKSRISSRVKQNVGTFSGCTADKRFRDLTLCSIEVMFTGVLALHMAEGAWECLALGLRYFKELENWLKILVFSFASVSLSSESNIEVLKIFSSLGICLSWLELIFMVGRYPFLGGRFSIMFYSISKRIVQSALAFFIMVIAFGFAFFIINFGSEGEQFENPWKSLLKIFVMVLGEFEFDNLYDNSSTSSLNLIFTMILLIGLIVAGSVIMLNLIVAFIITDVHNLLETSRDQVIVNQVNN